jgi:adenosylhomocysteine nucleosidase
MGTAKRTWLVIAAERRELDGILKRFGKSTKLSWHAKFAREAEWNGDRWLLIANGPGALAAQALEQRIDVTGIVSTGFCGALDPALKIGDVVSDVPLSLDHVVSTAEEKRALRAQTGASIVEMESAAVMTKAAEWGAEFYSVRAVSDTSAEDMPLDFNLYRDPEGRFSRTRIALAAMTRPFTAIPALLRLERNCKIAARSLGDYFAHCRL